jgi:hypothetical protein
VLAEGGALPHDTGGMPPPPLASCSSQASAVGAPSREPPRSACASSATRPRATHRTHPTKRLALLTHTSCLESRPNYRCEPPEIWYRFGPGALTGRCETTKRFRADQFPKDHLRDMFAAFRGTDVEGKPSPDTKILAPVVLLVARERGEHANLFHASTSAARSFGSARRTPCAGSTTSSNPPRSRART